MKSQLLSIFATFLAAATASAAAPSFDGLLAHGSSQRFWIARVETPAIGGQKQPQTTFYLRVPGDSTLQRLARIDGRAVALAHRGTQLAALLASGNWILASETGGGSEGPPLPGSARMVAIVGGDDSFRALGLTAVNLTTAPTTATTQVVGERLVLGYFELVNGSWKRVGDLPPEVVAGKLASLAIIDRIPTIAYLTGNRAVRLLHLNGSAWADFQSLELDTPALWCELLPGTQTPVLWALRGKGADSLEFLSPGHPVRHVPLSFVPASAENISVAYALGQIRVLWSTDGALHEQDLDPTDGAAVGSVLAVELPPEVPFLNIARASEYVIWGALIFAVLGALRWRRVMQGMVFDLEKIQLAPLPRRFSAGLIDLFPIIIAMVLLDRPNLSPKAVEIIGLSGCGLYLLHTMVGEMLTARSLGKWLLGLSVVALDGERPTRTAVLIRNLLRVIDLGLGFVPLIVVLVSPLRQRTGDVAAGTLVVRATEQA